MRNSLTLPDTFGGALRLLRKRAQLTQDELGRAVGYSREQIARLENGTRLPDLAVIAALFVPALFERQETPLVEQFMALAGQTRTDQQVTITHTRRTRVQLSSETIAAPGRPQHLPPAPLVPLLGRDQDVAELRALLRTARLVTLVGAPGIGKSRLALEVANLAAAEFADGAVWVPLADAASAADVPYAVVRALALTPSPSQSPEEAIADYLSTRRLLVAQAALHQPHAAGPVWRAGVAAGAAARARPGAAARSDRLGRDAGHATAAGAGPRGRSRLQADR